MNSIKLSVVLTTYCRADELKWTLDSLLEQTRQPDELIICDDASKDHTAEVVGSYEGKFPELIYLKSPQNQRMPRNLNMGLRKARGEFIANLHDADTFHPQLLEKWADALDAYPDAGFVFSGTTSHGVEGKEDQVSLHPCEPYTDGVTFFRKHFVGKFGSLVRGTVMGRKAVYEELNYFNPVWGVEADVDMWMRICEKYGVAYVNESLQYCHGEYLDRSLKLERLNNYYAMLDWNAERVVKSKEEANSIRKLAYQTRRSRFLYLAATQVKRLNFGIAFQLAIWGLRPQLNHRRKALLAAES